MRCDVLISRDVPGSLLSPAHVGDALVPLLRVSDGLDRRMRLGHARMPHGRRAAC